jgi:uncharacterized protein (TIGR03437 family)
MDCHFEDFRLRPCVHLSYRHASRWRIPQACNFARVGGFKRITIVGSPVSFFPRIFNYFASSERAARPLREALIFLALLPLLYAATTIQVGGGAPTPQIAFLFQQAFYRNSFNTVAILPPLANVRRLGTSGLVQEFETTAKDINITMALVMPNQNALASATSVLQIFPDIYGYYNTLGPTTVGMPTTDTQICPGGAPAACTYQIFSSNYALFAYATPLVNGQDFSIKDPEFTKWQSLGGLTGPVGFPIDASKAITASTGTTANQQLFSGGAFYGTTSGTNNGAYHAVSGPIYTTYNANLAAAGALGLPTSDEVILPSGTHQQTFEGGTIQYTVGSTPVILLPVTAVRIVGPGNVSTAIQLNLNDSAQLSVQVFASTGAILTGRTVTWSVTNNSVISITPNGYSATVKATGGGAAQVTAIVNGIASPALPITVIAPCCVVGDGAPASVQAAFQDALSRNQLKVATPLPNPAQRAGNGYIQSMTPVGAAQPVLVTKADSSPLAYVVSGAILTAYQNGGGPSGGAGFPNSDVTAGGRQSFDNAAIAGNPAYLVTGQILSKWAGLGYETGATGLPAAAASAFSTALGIFGQQQPFQGGTIFAITSGAHHGETYLVSGLILARYIALGGPIGAYGTPLGDETANGALHSQTFENGYINYTVGDAAAVDHPNPRTPAISAFPTSAVPGGRLMLSVTGFANNATVKVTVGSQPDFTVTLPVGVFSWNYVIPSSATVGTVKLHAVDVVSGTTADGSFSIKSTASLGPKLTIVQGDAQSAGVSSLLPLPLQVAVRDSGGNPLSNVTVTFMVSPGASLSASSVLTDANGLASTQLRLPSSVGIAEVTAQALGQFVTFGARAVSSPALGVPKMTAASTNLLGAGPAQIAQKGTMLTAAAMVLRYYQNGGQIQSPKGSADPDTLNKYLSNCGTGCDGYLTNPDTGEQVANLWRLSGFTGGTTDISVEKSDLASLQTLVAGGSPVLVFLTLAANGVPVGGTTVVAIGVADDGSLIIQDPNPVLARTNMNDYLNGFQAANSTWRGTIVSAARVVIQSPPANAFLLAAVSQSTNGGGVSLDVESARGACGPVLEIPDAAAIGSTSLVTLRSSRFVYCNGADPAYQANLSAPGPYRAFVEGAGLYKDLSGTAAAAWSLTFLSSGILTVTAQNASFTSSSVLNAASFLPGIAPGGLFSLFGAGLASSSADTTVKFGDSTAKLILKSPFQLNGQVPPDLAPGSYFLTVQSAWGTVSQPVTVSQTAPGVFVVATEAGNRTVGAVINQDGTLNDLGTPARRGDVLTVYCTNLGTVQAQGDLFVATNPVTAVLNTTELPVQYAGLTPGFVGLYQVNVPIPGATVPGANLALAIKAGNVASNTVIVAIQ